MRERSRQMSERRSHMKGTDHRRSQQQSVEEARQRVSSKLDARPSRTEAVNNAGVRHTRASGGKGTGMLRESKFGLSAHPGHVPFPSAPPSNVTGRDTMSGTTLPFPEKPETAVRPSRNPEEPKRKIAESDV